MSGNRRPVSEVELKAAKDEYQRAKNDLGDLLDRLKKFRNLYSNQGFGYLGFSGQLADFIKSAVINENILLKVQTSPGALNNLVVDSLTKGAVAIPVYFRGSVYDLSVLIDFINTKLEEQNKESPQYYANAIQPAFAEWEMIQTVQSALEGKDAKSAKLKEDEQLNQATSSMRILHDRLFEQMQQVLNIKHDLEMQNKDHAVQVIIKQAEDFIGGSLLAVKAEKNKILSTYELNPEVFKLQDPITLDFPAIPLYFAGRIIDYNPDDEKLKDAIKKGGKIEDPLTRTFHGIETLQPAYACIKMLNHLTLQVTKLDTEIKGMVASFPLSVDNICKMAGTVPRSVQATEYFEDAKMATQKKLVEMAEMAPQLVSQILNEETYTSVHKTKDTPVKIENFNQFVDRRAQTAQAAVNHLKEKILADFKDLNHKLDIEIQKCPDGKSDKMLEQVKACYKNYSAGMPVDECYTAFKEKASKLLEKPKEKPKEKQKNATLPPVASAGLFSGNKINKKTDANGETVYILPKRNKT